MTAKKGDAKPKKRETKQAEKAAAKKLLNLKLHPKVRKNPQKFLLSKIDKVMESNFE